MDVSEALSNFGHSLEVSEFEFESLDLSLEFSTVHSGPLLPLIIELLLAEQLPILPVLSNRSHEVLKIVVVFVCDLDAAVTVFVDFLEVFVVALVADEDAHPVAGVLGVVEAEGLVDELEDDVQHGEEKREQPEGSGAVGGLDEVDEGQIEGLGEPDVTYVNAYRE